MSPIGRWNRFVSEEMEAAYQNSILTGNIRQGRLVLWLSGFGALVFARQDFITFGSSTALYLALALRVVCACLAVIGLLRLRRSITPPELERWMLGLTGVLIVLVLFGYATRSGPRMAHGLIALCVFALGLAVPMRFAYQAVAAIAIATTANVVLLSKEPDPFVVYGGFFVTGLSLMLTLITGASIHRARREGFAAHEKQRELREGLEIAMAEIKTLRGLLPICAACKKIRQDDGAWHQIETYVQKHTHAQFTHGICPEPGAPLSGNAARQDSRVSQLRPQRRPLREKHGQYPSGPV